MEKKLNETHETPKLDGFFVFKVPTIQPVTQPAYPTRPNSTRRERELAEISKQYEQCEELLKFVGVWK